jgi:hypothetical protein
MDFMITHNQLVDPNPLLVHMLDKFNQLEVGEAGAKRPFIVHTTPAWKAAKSIGAELKIHFIQTAGYGTEQRHGSWV